MSITGFCSSSRRRLSRATKRDRLDTRPRITDRPSTTRAESYGSCCATPIELRDRSILGKPLPARPADGNPAPSWIPASAGMTCPVLDTGPESRGGAPRIRNRRLSVPGNLSSALRVRTVTIIRPGCSASTSVLLSPRDNQTRRLNHPLLTLDDPPSTTEHPCSISFRPVPRQIRTAEHQLFHFPANCSVAQIGMEHFGTQWNTSQERSTAPLLSRTAGGVARVPLSNSEQIAHP